VAPGQSLRVAQWATGNIGTKSLRGVIEHPSLELVGVRVYAPDKVGVDAGELCGLATPGVAATDDVEVILAAQPDCVLYMARALDPDDVCRLLAAGANVVTTRGELHRPASMDPELRERVEAACREGGTSIHSTGSSPGFITEAVPLVLTSIQRSLDSLTIDEYADLSERNSPDLLFGIMGFGRAPAAMDEGRLNHGRRSFGPSLALTADALGLPLDSIEASGEIAVARHDTTIAAGTIEAGTVAAQRVIVDGMRDGRAVIRFRANWYCTTDLDPAWDLRSTGWRVNVEGDAPLDVELRFPFALDEMAARSPGYTANRAVNAVPFVCAAAPGIRTSLDLPQIVADLG
jgi:4-hydroxy-tetrahydrodipicolinate reductase